MKIQIQEPCHERWDKMTPNEKGAFCAICEKDVVDFQRMTDAELIQFFQNVKGETCGRFRNDQLQRNLNTPDATPRKSNFFVRTLTRLSFGLGLLFSGGCSLGETNGKVAPQDVEAMNIQEKQFYDFFKSLLSFSIFPNTLRLHEIWQNQQQIGKTEPIEDMGKVAPIETPPPPPLETEKDEMPPPICDTTKKN